MLDNYLSSTYDVLMLRMFCIIFLFLHVGFADFDSVRIGIFTHYINSDWDLDSVDQGLRGSESAVVYMSLELVKLGYQVEVNGFPPENSPHSQLSANPRFVRDDDLSKYDIAIVWRYPGSIKRIAQRAPQVYLWPHDIYYWVPPLQFGKGLIDCIDDVFWLSEWQRKNWIVKNPCFAKFTKIFGNGIDPNKFGLIQPKENPYACIYSSSYERGLAHLLEIWPVVKHRFPRATLDIYSGWKDAGPYQEEMRTKIKQLASLGVIEHGLVSHKELYEAYSKASLWTYPCDYPETFCITALEAQISGTIPVYIEKAALRETCMGGYKCFDVKDYLPLLLGALAEVEKITSEDRAQLSEGVQDLYTWEQIAKRWHEVFSLCKKKH